MNYVASAITKSISVEYQTAIAKAINIAPFVLAFLSGLISIGTVSLFRR